MEYNRMQPTVLFDRKGITLVEAIVAGALSIFTILTGTALYKVNADQIRGSFIHCKTGTQYQTVIDQIERFARQAKVIVASNDPTFYDTDLSAKSADVVYFIDGTGATLGGYRRSGTILEELKVTFTPFKVGSDTVHVVNVGTNNTFSIAGDRKSVQLNLSVFGTDGSIKDTMVSKRETFVCRN
jgi:hypothetical protein